ncbi:MAG: hypothetical protein KDH09_09000 [Chrysiogenetes bacterium]|nr:hypothetical protein [Chrysiogenetes bacterium]
MTEQSRPVAGRMPRQGWGAFLARSALALAALVSFGCEGPKIPEPATRDPQVGALKTLGDVPLFAKRTTEAGQTPVGSEFFDTNGAGSPYILQGASGVSELILYYVGTDATSSQVSGGIGEARSSDRGFTFENRRLLLVRRNRVTGDLAPLDPPSPLPPRLTDSFDSPGVLDPMVLEDCPFAATAGGSCLFYAGPGIFDAVNDDDQDGLRYGFSSEFVRPPDAPARPIPLVPSAISVVTLPGLNEVASNGVPILMANKDIEDDGATDCGLSGTDPLNPSDGQLPCTDDIFYTNRARTFDPQVEVCSRRSLNATEDLIDDGCQRNNGINSDQCPGGTDSTVTIEAGPYPWESGGVGDPFVMRDPFRDRYLMYYTCTEEFGEVTANGCEERLIDRICVAELTQVGSQVVARRLLMDPGAGDVDYASPSAPTVRLRNNIVLQGGNFAKENADFDRAGASDPTILLSRSVLGTVLWRMWYTGTNGNNAHRIGITGSFDGFDWDADDQELRFSTLVPTNPILVQADQAQAPTSLFASDNILRVYYESITRGTEPSINLATIVDLTDDVPPTIFFDSPVGDELTIEQGCSVTFALSFEDAGGSGIDQSSFNVQFTDISIDELTDPGVQVQFQNDITREDVTVAQDADWSDQFPSFRFGSGDSATVQLQLNEFRLNPTLANVDQAVLSLEIEIFDRNDNRSVKGLELTLVEAGQPTVCDAN